MDHACSSAALTCLTVKPHPRSRFLLASSSLPLSPPTAFFSCEASPGCFSAGSSRSGASAIATEARGFVPDSDARGRAGDRRPEARGDAGRNGDTGLDASRSPREPALRSWGGAAPVSAAWSPASGPPRFARRRMRARMSFFLPEYFFGSDRSRNSVTMVAIKRLRRKWLKRMTIE